MIEQLFSSTVEFKLDITLKNYGQAFAYMVKVANDMVIESLTNGKLVKSVIVYGLLLLHRQKDLCVPMKYTCTFNNKSDTSILNWTRR